MAHFDPVYRKPRKFGKKMYRFIGYYNKTDAGKMAKKMRGDGVLVRVVTDTGYHEGLKWTRISVWARIEG